MISILRTGRGYTGAELADVMGVSQRTVYRDVVDLSGLVPIYYDDGYRLLSDTFLANLTFTREELVALKLGVQMQALAEASHLGAATQSVLAKIDEQLERRFQGEADDGDVISVHVKAHPMGEKTVRVLRDLEDAVRRRLTVEFSYYTLSRNEKTKRTVDPYGLTFRRHSWYLVGYCHLRHQARVFRLDRISSVTATSHKFERPKGFSLEEFFADTWEVFASGPMADVVLRFSRHAEFIARPTLGGRGEFNLERKGNKIVFRGEVPVTDEFVRWLLTLGENVEVLEPAELRDRVASRHRSAAELYGPIVAEAGSRGINNG
jgi:predicted DNA-binding transcriptional regulator YafY